ncbi:hypothetical protein ACFX2I_037843 [Malus domestica]
MTTVVTMLMTTMVVKVKVTIILIQLVTMKMMTKMVAKARLVGETWMNMTIIWRNEWSFIDRVNKGWREERLRDGLSYPLQLTYM